MQQFNPWPRKEEEREAKGVGERRNKERQALNPFISGAWMEERGCRWLSQPLFSPEELLFSIWDLAFLTNRLPIHSQRTFTSSWNKVKKDIFFFYAFRTLDGHKGSKSVFDSHSIENSKLDAFIQMCIQAGFRVRPFFVLCLNPRLKARNMHSGQLWGHSGDLMGGRNAGLCLHRGCISCSSYVPVVCKAYFCQA